MASYARLVTANIMDQKKLEATPYPFLQKCLENNKGEKYPFFLFYEKDMCCTCIFFGPSCVFGHGSQNASKTTKAQPIYFFLKKKQLLFLFFPY